MQNKLEAIPALVFISAWANIPDKIVAVGGRAILPENDVIEGAYEAQANGHYSVITIEPTNRLTALASNEKLELFCYKNGCSWAFVNKANRDEIVACTASDKALFISDLEMYIGSRSDKEIQKMQARLEKAIPFDSDDCRYLTAYSMLLDAITTAKS